MTFHFQLLSKIMLFLPPVDRVRCSLVCRRWAKLMQSSQLLHDVWLEIAQHEMQAAFPVLVRSKRQYTNLRLLQVDFSEFDSEFWGKIGENLFVMELELGGDDCSLSTNFYAILHGCKKLKSLKITRDIWKPFDVDFVPPGDAGRAQLRESLSNLSHLHLGIAITADILDHLLGLMPNVTSVYLSNVKWFFRNSDILERLSSLLRKNGIIRTEADFRHVDSTKEDFIKFVDGVSGTLEGLQMNARHFTEDALNAIASCTKLRSLTLWQLNDSFKLSDLEKLFLNSSPALEILELDSMEKLKLDNMEPLFKLKKLRTLKLGSRRQKNRITNESLCWLKEMSTLVNLDLNGFNVDSQVIQGLGCLKNLRTLALRACPDSECFEAICENFGRLTELSLGRVRNLTDVDGSKLCGFEELRNLSFDGGYGFGDETFKGGVGSRAMKFLSIHGSYLTDAGLVSIASHHASLEELHLLNCKRITDAGLVALLQNEPRLKKLFLEASGFMRYKQTATLRNFCPRLRHWMINDDEDMSDSEDD